MGITVKNICKVLFVLFVILSSIYAEGYGQTKGKSVPIMSYDKDGDLKVSEEEYKGPELTFRSIDTDTDGYITWKEIRAYRKMEEAKKKETQYFVIKEEKTQDEGPFQKRKQDLMGRVFTYRRRAK